MILDKNTIETITNFNQVDGDIYPEAELPENARKLRGFIWRGDERIKTKDDIFPQEELDLDAKIQAESKVEKAKIDKPLEPSKETLDYDKNNPKPKTEQKETQLVKPTVKGKPVVK